MAIGALDSKAVIAPIQVSEGYWRGVIRRLSHDPVAMFALAIIVALVLMAILRPIWHRPIR